MSGRDKLCYLSAFSTDEKERFDPSQFQESIIQGLNQTGTDLEAVAKFLDASGAKLDYRRYAETLFDILVAGGMLGKMQDYFIFLLPLQKTFFHVITSLMVIKSVHCTAEHYMSHQTYSILENVYILHSS